MVDTEICPTILKNFSVGFPLVKWTEQEKRFAIGYLTSLVIFRSASPRLKIETPH